MLHQYSTQADTVKGRSRNSEKPTLYTPNADPEWVYYLTGIVQPGVNSKPCPGSATRAVLTPTGLIFTRPCCKRWRCDSCLPRLLWMWAAHLCLGFQDSADFYVNMIPDRDWGSAKKIITSRRKRAEPGIYARIDELVVSTSPPPFDRDRPIWFQAACGSIGNALKRIRPFAAGKVCRPVSTSRALSLPKRKSSGGVCIGPVPPKVSAASIRDIARGMGLPASLSDSGGGWVVRLPVGEGDARRLVAAIQLMRA